LAEAEREWDIKKYEIADQRQFDRERKQRFQHSLSRFCFFAGFLVVLMILTSGLGGWAWIARIAKFLLFLPGAPWALKLAWNGWRIYRPNEYSYTQEFQRWRRKQQMRRAVGGAVRRLMGSF
ncbi:MAG: 2TM domain-containing protein, partial [Leptolyngbya sp.]|nr:2TM domain-containing protein [Leptolyngbya sp.]